jgi:hypothetical protein
MKDGALLCEALREAARRRKAGAPKDADHILVSTREAMDDRLAGDDTDNFDCSRAARELEGMLMRIGRLERIQGVLVNLDERPCIRELRRDEACTGSDLTKRNQLANLMFANLNAFFTKHAVNLEGGGSRTLASQQAVDTVLSAVVTPELFESRLGATLIEQMNVTYPAVRRALELRRLEIDHCRSYYYLPRAGLFDYEDSCFPTLGMCPDIDFILTFHDGCAAQFCSFKTHFAVAGTIGRLRVSRCDCRCIEYEGKCACDGCTAWIKCMIFRIAHEPFECGTQALVRQLAMRFPRPASAFKTPRFAGHRSNNINKIYYAYLPPGFGKQEFVDANESCKLPNSSDYFSFRSTPGGQLLAQARACSCDGCLDNFMNTDGHCLLTDPMLAGPIVRHSIPSATSLTNSGIVQQVPGFNFTALEDFWRSLNVGSFVAVRL